VFPAVPEGAPVSGFASGEMLLFGLTTAFLFAMIQRIWPLGTRERYRQS